MMVSRILPCALLVLSHLTSPALALELITAEEANRQDDYYDNLRASPFPAPEIKAHGLQDANTSPLDFVIEIKPHGGASINMNSLQLIYQKTPKENLFARVRDLVEVQGKTVVIRLRNAEVPVGRHQILVLAEDTRGRTAEKALTFRVCAKRGC
jgi:hypothetical protein